MEKLRVAVENLCNAIEAVDLNNDNLERQAVELKKATSKPDKQSNNFDNHVNTLHQLILSNLQIVNGNLDTFRNYLRMTADHARRG